MTAMCGYRIHETVLGHVPFVCPHCGLDREGIEVEPQRWWTLAGRRVVPLAAHERVIECTTCGHRCDTGALDIPTTEMLAVYLDEATRAAAAHVVRATTDPTGKVSPLVASVAVAAVRDADQSYDADRLASDLCGFDSTDTVSLLTRLASELTAHGKQGFLRRMTQIAVADGSLDDRERRAVTEIGSTLGMAAPHINGVMAVAELQYLVA